MMPFALVSSSSSLACLRLSQGAFHFFAHRREVVKYRKKTRERREHESQEEQTGAECTNASLVSAGLQDVLGMTQWRKEHPQATWAEIEAEVDEQINQLRAQLIQDLVQMGQSEDWSQKPEQERPRCASCGKPLWARGEQTRWIQTTGGEAVKPPRTSGTRPAFRAGVV